MNKEQAPLRLFEGYGIEIESMVVDHESLDVRPLVDELLRRAAGTEDWVGDVEDGPIALSNEFVAHVVEFKTNGPAPGWRGLERCFRESANRLAGLLGEWNAMLLPTAMHPWMEPSRETRFWQHDNGPVYRAYHKLFDARRHGWSNLQSVHLNLPFADEQEFGRLMAAIRSTLPLVPALAASSPIVEGRVTGLLDNRLEFYRTNSERVPAMTGMVIPEPIYSEADYRASVLAPIDEELRLRGADEVLLGNEWTNARGAIARFDRMAIEIRLIDAQECAASDLAVAAMVSGLIRGLVEERWASYSQQMAFSSATLGKLLVAAIAEGPAASLRAMPEFARLFGRRPAQAPDLTSLLLDLAPDVFEGGAELEPSLRAILDDGVLAQRILRATGPNPSRSALRDVYRELAACQLSGRSFAT